MKTRMNVVDCRRMVAELQEQAVGKWLHNIYDLNSKTFIMKLSVPEQDKVLLLLESGVRFHMTNYKREKSNIPSGFSMKLRKHIRGRKLSAVTQLGFDRVIDFTFGFGDKCHHLILELFASGNIVLTDNEYNILSLLRTHVYDSSVRVAVKEKYPIDMARAVVPSEDDPADTLDTDEIATIANAFSIAPNSVQAFLVQLLAGSKTDAKGKKTGWALKQALSMKGSPVQQFGKDLIEHCLLKVGFSPQTKVTEEWLQEIAESEDGFAKLASTLEQAPRIIASLGAKQLRESGEAVAAHIILEPLKANKTPPPSGDGNDEAPIKRYFSSFEAMPYLQHGELEKQEYTTFNTAIDEYFSKIESQRMEKDADAARTNAEKRVNKIKSDQEKRIGGLEQAVRDEERRAELVACNLQDVDNALMVVRSAVASGMDWDELNLLVKREKQNGNPVASLIHKLKLEENKVTLLLWDEDNDDAQSPAMKVDLDINLSAHANIRSLYENKKKAAAKAVKTVEAATRAIEDAKRKTERDLQKRTVKRALETSRKVFWFEKFHWFVTSEGYLVLSGRDAQQNELLVKRYLRKSHGDLYVHADFHGAASCIVRNIQLGKAIPNESILQAGAMTVCRSSAWDAKIISSAWYVNADQVSKTAPTGEYLPTGSFMIRGKKTYLPASRMEMGFGYIFRYDETQLTAEELEVKRSKEWRMMPAQRTQEEEVDLGEGDEGVDGEVVDVGGAVEGTAEAVDIDDEAVEGAGGPTGGVGGVVEGVAEATDGVAEAFVDVDEAVVDADEAAEGADEPTDRADEPAEDEAVDGDWVGPSDEQTPTAADIEGVSTQDDAMSTTTSGSRKLSAKERRDLRKQRKKKGSNPLPQPTQAPSRKTKKKAKEPKPAPVPKVRGKSGKLKKMKQKYADQDEDERRLAMLALGNPIKEPETQQEVGAEEQGTDEMDATPTAHAYSNVRPKKPQKEISDVPAQVEDSVLVHFTAKPDPNDGLLFAIPFCGPIASMTHFKYRIKLTPGSQKKGRAAKTAVELISRNPKCTDTERSLIRAVPDTENIQAIVGGVTISAPGAAKLQKAAKNQTRKQRKQAAKKKQ